MDTTVIDMPTTAVAERIDTGTLAVPRSQGDTLMRIIEAAAAGPSFDIDKVRGLLEIKERWDANEARNAYNEAFARFKAEAVKVVRNVTIKDGPLRGKKHADLFSITDAATESLSKYGLSASWRVVSDEKDWIRIACRIKHSAGHFEEVEFSGPIDNGPGRNAIQARKSSVTYLERITLLLALGLAESDADDDGATGGGAPGSTLPPATPREAALPPYDDGALQANLPAWKAAIEAGKLTPYKVIAKVESKHSLTPEQKKVIRALAPATEGAQA